MNTIHARVSRASSARRRITRRHVMAAVLGATSCATAVACDGVEPTATQASVRALAVEPDIGTVAKPEPSLVAYVTGRAGITDVSIMDIASGRSHAITRDRANAWSPVWSPDGTQIAFSSNRDALGFNIWVVPAAGGTPVKYTGAGGTSPDWSPDGSKIAFSSYSGTTDIWVVNADRTSQTRITNTTDAWENEPVWSPNGSKLAYSSARAGSTQIWIMNADGTGQAQLTGLTDTSPSYSPTWSPDGTKIAFASFRAGRGDLYVMNADGTNQTRITDTTTGTESDPRWSARGIVFSAIVDGTQSLFLINPDGTGLTQLSRGSTPSYEPAWKP
jgi:Tol biopolymer transport system component